MAKPWPKKNKCKNLQTCILHNENAPFHPSTGSHFAFTISLSYASVQAAYQRMDTNHHPTIRRSNRDYFQISNDSENYAHIVEYDIESLKVNLLVWRVALLPSTQFSLLFSLKIICFKQYFYGIFLNDLQSYLHFLVIYFSSSLFFYGYVPE